MSRDDALGMEKRFTIEHLSNPSKVAASATRLAVRSPPVIDGLASTATSFFGGDWCIGSGVVESAVVETVAIWLRGG